MNDEDVLKICDIVRQTAFDLHNYLRHGHMEKVYENGLFRRMRNKNMNVLQQFSLEVLDEDGAVLGIYIADLFVEDVLIVELKACKTLADEHIAQALGYIRASRKRHALLINFGSPKIQFKKLIL